MNKQITESAKWEIAQNYYNKKPLIDSLNKTSKKVFWIMTSLFFCISVALSLLVNPTMLSLFAFETFPLMICSTLKKQVYIETDSCLKNYTSVREFKKMLKSGEFDKMFDYITNQKSEYKEKPFNQHSFFDNVQNIKTKTKSTNKTKEDTFDL